MKTNNKFYETRWFCILLLFLFAPAGIFLLWKYKHFSTTVNAVLSAVFSIFFIVLLVSPQQNDTMNDDAITDITETKEKNTAEPVKETPTASPNENTEPPANTSSPKNKDLELITKNNHPTLFSNTNDAHEFWGDDKGLIGWKDRADKKIAYPDTYTNANGSGVDWSPLILELARDSNFAPYQSDYIFGIHIYLKNFDKSIQCNLNDALNIANDYLPQDILTSYYKYKRSVSYKAIKASKQTDRYYEMVYSPNKKGKKERMKLKNNSYEYPIINIVLIENKTGNITDILIDLHQSICTSGRHSIAYGGDYKTVKWQYDLLTKRK